MVRRMESVNVVGTGTKQCCRLPLNPDRPTISTAGLTGIDIEAADQVVVVAAGSKVEMLHSALKENGQCLPFARPDLVTGGTIGGAVAMNFPHPLEAQVGSWRDWILGMQVVLANGMIVKTGSKAVKNVAGYDVHKLMIGARGTLGIITSVTLKTYPVDALPASEAVGGRGLDKMTPWVGKGIPHWVQRTRRNDFERAVENASEAITQVDRPSSTLWALVPPEEELPRYPQDWVVRSGCGIKNLEFTDPTHIALMRRTKDIFDPTGKLNPGEMGIF
jgi:FAD/FMN-containing dehydrogenase